MGPPLVADDHHVRRTTFDLALASDIRIAHQKTLFETWLNNGIAASVDPSIDLFADHFADPATAEAVAAYYATAAS